MCVCEWCVAKLIIWWNPDMFIWFPCQGLLRHFMEISHQQHVDTWHLKKNYSTASLTCSAQNMKQIPWPIISLLFILWLWIFPQANRECSNSFGFVNQNGDIAKIKNKLLVLMQRRKDSQKSLFAYKKSCDYTLNPKTAGCRRWNKGYYIMCTYCAWQP